MKGQKQIDKSRRGNGKYKNQARGNNSNRRNDLPKCDNGDYRPGDVNDPNYYFTDETLKQQIATFSFNQFTGVPFKMATDNQNKAITKTNSTIMSIWLNPSAGFTTGVGVQNSVNLAALSLYTKLSANNAKTSNYAPQDLTTLVLGVGQLIAIAGHCARAFGLARLFNYRNRAYPKTITKAVGIDYDDLINNFADYRNRYNLLMVTASQIPIPANIPYFAKCSEIYSHVYLDMEGSSMAQTYAFCPKSTWLFNEAAEGGTSLDVIELQNWETSEPKTMNTLLGDLQNMIGALLNSTTLNAIYSDILRVADKEGMSLYSFTTLPDDYTVMPVYNSEIRKWINNLVIMGYPTGTPTDANHTPGNRVLPDPDNNGIKYRPQFKLPMSNAIEPVLNFDTGNATVDDIIDATRLTTAYTMLIHNQAAYTDECALPDYYVTRINIYEGDRIAGKLSSVGLKFADAANEVVQLDAMSTIAAYSNFDWSPTLYLIDKNNSLYDVVQDFNYFTTVDYDYLQRLQESCFFGLLSIR